MHLGVAGKIVQAFILSYSFPSNIGFTLVIGIKRNPACSSSGTFLVTTRKDSSSEGLTIECNGRYTLYVAPDLKYDLLIVKTTGDNWDKVAVVWDMTSLTVYYDGNQQGSTSTTTSSPTNVNDDNRVGFGPQYTTSNNVGSGLEARLDGLYIFNRPLSAGQVSAHTLP